MFNLVNELLTSIKREKPLILNITNHVTIDFVANGLLSIGASPVMSFSIEEVEDLVKLSSAIILNLGTLNDPFNQLCHYVCKVGNHYKKPIILDPVGAGASLYRTQTCHSIIENYQIDIIRANAGEIMAMAGFHSMTKGVDSQVNSKDSIKFAEMLSSQCESVVCMSGKIDVIMDKFKKNELDRGSSLMPMVTGTGCLLSSIVGAFNAIHANRFEATSAASLFYAICGELAEKNAAGPASFKTNLLDILSHNPEKEYYEST